MSAVGFCGGCGQPRQSPVGPCPFCGTQPGLAPTAYGTPTPQPGYNPYGVPQPIPQAMPPGYPTAGTPSPPGVPGYGMPGGYGYARKPGAPSHPIDYAIAVCGIVLFLLSFVPIEGQLLMWTGPFTIRHFMFLALFGLGIGVLSICKAIASVPIPQKIVSFFPDQLAIFVGFYGTVIVLSFLMGTGNSFSTEARFSKLWPIYAQLPVSLAIIVLAFFNLKADGELRAA